MTEKIIDITNKKYPKEIIEEISLYEEPYIEKCNLCKRNLGKQRVVIEDYLLSSQKKEVKKRLIFCCEICFFKWCEKYVEGMKKGV